MTLFPLLPRRTSLVFGIAFAGLVTLLVATALSRWQPPLIALVGLGVPLLLVAYVFESGGVARLSAPVLAIATMFSAALGVGWAIATEAAVRRGGGDALGIPPSTTWIVTVSLAVPAGLVAGLLAPVILVRFLRPGRRESLTGYLVGALSAAGFIAASTLTRLGPSFVAGIDSENTRSATNLAIAAMVQGVALPVIAVSVAGAVGAGLWYPVPAERPRWYTPASPRLSMVFAVLAVLGLGAIDIAAPPFGVDMALYAVLALGCLAVLRVVLRATMRDAPRPPSTTARRVQRLAVALTVAVPGLTAGSVGLATALAPTRAEYVCPPDCGTPPIAKPLSTNPRFTPDSGEFSVSYPGEGTAYTATFESNGVVLELTAGDGGVLRLFGQPAEGKSAREIAQQLIADHYRDATFAYEVPNALVGYQLGYGEVADVFPAASVGDDSRARVLVMVAVKNDYALVAAGAGPYREFTPEFGSGHPSGANFMLALDMGKYVNSFQWRGDPPR